MKIFALYNIKGGVGKTAAAVNLAYLSAREERVTLLWDLDPQGAASYCLGEKGKLKGGSKALLRAKRLDGDLIRRTTYDRLDLLPADFSYRHLDLALSEDKRPERRFRKLLENLDMDYHHIFIDCPPGITLTSESMFEAADVLVVPVIPATLSLRTLDQIDGFLKKAELEHLNRLAFYSMVDRRKGLHRRLVDLRHDHDFLFSTIPYASDVERMAEQRAPLMSYAPKSRAAQAYESLWSELKQVIA
jgi:chromosome partitioning protein